MPPQTQLVREGVDEQQQVAANVMAAMQALKLSTAEVEAAAREARAEQLKMAEALRQGRAELEAAAREVRGEQLKIAKALKLYTGSGGGGGEQQQEEAGGEEEKMGVDLLMRPGKGGVHVEAAVRDHQPGGWGWGWGWKFGGDGEDKVQAGQRWPRRGAGTLYVMKDMESLVTRGKGFYIHTQPEYYCIFFVALAAPSIPLAYIYGTDAACPIVPSVHTPLGKGHWLPLPPHF